MPSPVFQPGTFEYIEAKIRRDAECTTFGGDFEWLCKWFLENAPRYRGQFEKVWLWKDWPTPVKAGDGSSQLKEVLIPGEEWKLVASGFGFTEAADGICRDP